MDGLISENSSQLNFIVLQYFTFTSEDFVSHVLTYYIYIFILAKRLKLMAWY